eukprot:scaffold28238_cov59-Phaeocystis_antarctica.AAC.6
MGGGGMPGMMGVMGGGGVGGMGGMGGGAPCRGRRRRGPSRRRKRCWATCRPARLSRGSGSPPPPGAPG